MTQSDLRHAVQELPIYIRQLLYAQVEVGLYSVEKAISIASIMAFNMRAERNQEKEDMKTYLKQQDQPSFIQPEKEMEYQ